MTLLTASINHQGLRLAVHSGWRFWAAKSNGYPPEPLGALGRRNKPRWKQTNPPFRGLEHVLPSRYFSSWFYDVLCQSSIPMVIELDKVLWSRAYSFYMKLP